MGSLAPDLLWNCPAQLAQKWWLCLAVPGHLYIYNLPKEFWCSPRLHSHRSDCITPWLITSQETWVFGWYLLQICFAQYLLQIRFAQCLNSWYKNYFQEGRCFYLQCATWRNRWHLKLWIVARDRVADLLWRRREETGFASAWRGQGQEGGREGGGRTRNPPNG